jgi:hypothetical protein
MILAEEMITPEILRKCSEEFRNEEGRAYFYDIAVEIADKYPLQAAIIVLATWNTGRFRFMMSNPKNLMDLKEALDKCRPLFEQLKEKRFQTANFDGIGEIVKQIYSILSKVKGVEYTGASKLMHLFCPNLFVMWDGFIRRKYRVGKSPEDFLKFQKLMQDRFGKIKWDELRTLPKVIDEYNYVKFTLPRLRKQRLKKRGEA